MSITPRAPLDAEDRERLLSAAADRSVGERLLAYLVLGEGLTLAQAIAVRGSDVCDRAVIVTTKTGERETRGLSPLAAELACRAVQDAAPDAMLVVTGRSGRPLSTAAARDILLGLARTSGVPVRSVHQLSVNPRIVAVA